MGRGGDNESLLGDGLFGSSQDLPTWRLFSNEEGGIEPEQLNHSEDEEIDMNFYKEFDTVAGVSEVGQDEGSISWTPHFSTPSLRTFRKAYQTMEGQAEALSDSHVRRETSV